MTENLSKLEFEVENARAKLAKDLSVLRSPQMYREFSTGLKSEAQSVVQRVVADLKSRAATNPTAVLAISAGIGWRLLKHPPIATALIGAGVLSLWRTTQVTIDEGDYRSTAQRFRQQVGEAVDTVKDYAAETAEAAQEKATTYAQSARETVQELAVSAAENAGYVVERSREAATEIPGKAMDAAQRAISQIGRAVNDEGFRDQMLLGAAGLAVAAALGIAYQRRTGDE